MTRKPIIIDPTELLDLIGTTNREAIRVETRERYASDERTAAYAQWARGEVPQWDMTDRYAEVIRGRTDVGARIIRVRVLDEPATCGQCYLLAHAAGRNEPLGEDVRCLSRRAARRSGIDAAGDWWLIDGQIVARLIFDQDDELTGAEVRTDIADVAEHIALSRAALQRALPYRAYTQQPTADC